MSKFFTSQRIFWLVTYRATYRWTTDRTLIESSLPSLQLVAMSGFKSTFNSFPSSRFPRRELALYMREYRWVEWSRSRHSMRNWSGPFSCRTSQTRSLALFAPAFLRTQARIRAAVTTDSCPSAPAWLVARWLQLTFQDWRWVKLAFQHVIFFQRLGIGSQRTTIRRVSQLQLVRCHISSSTQRSRSTLPQAVSWDLKCFRLFLAFTLPSCFAHKKAIWQVLRFHFS